VLQPRERFTAEHGGARSFTTALSAHEAGVLAGSADKSRGARGGRGGSDRRERGAIAAPNFPRIALPLAPSIRTSDRRRFSSEKRGRRCLSSSVDETCRAGKRRSTRRTDADYAIRPCLCGKLKRVRGAAALAPTITRGMRDKRLWKSDKRLSCR